MGACTWVQGVAGTPVVPGGLRRWVRRAQVQGGAARLDAAVLPPPPPLPQVYGRCIAQANSPYDAVRMSVRHWLQYAPPRKLVLVRAGRGSEGLGGEGGCTVCTGPQPGAGAWGCRAGGEGVG